VLLVVLTEVLQEPHRAQAGGLPPAEIVAAVAAAYGTGGTLAIVVGRQQAAGTELPVRAVEARAVRVARRSADNGQVAQRPFPAASMVKLFLAEDVLHRARTGALTLTPADLLLLAEMIRRSDDPAASAVWVRFDGARAVRDVAARYDLVGTEPPLRPGWWGEAMTTARDLARFLSLLPTLAHPEDAATLTDWMRGATPIAADGFDQRFGLFGVLPGEPAVKQGWMCCVGGLRHLHSVAVLDGRVVVLLSEVPRAVGYDQARAWLGAAAAAAPGPRTG
jgi:CubicO group peptidase (beta-lactamase class C family)